LIQGQGNAKSTPDILISLISQCEELGDAEARSYIAIADGIKQHNMARVVCW
jgi:Chitin synthase